MTNLLTYETITLLSHDELTIILMQLTKPQLFLLNEDVADFEGYSWTKKEAVPYIINYIFDNEADYNKRVVAQLQLIKNMKEVTQYKEVLVNREGIDSLKADNTYYKFMNSIHSFKTGERNHYRLLMKVSDYILQDSITFYKIGDI